jgi:hypothetical protein
MKLRLSQSKVARLKQDGRARVLHRSSQEDADGFPNPLKR